MNILIDTLPTSIEIDQVEYPINPNYKTCLNIILAYEDNELMPQEKHMILLKTLYKEVPHDITKAIQQGLLFLDGGEKEQGDGGSPSSRLYSFRQDAKFIYSSINASHNDALKRYDFIHWWDFITMFMEMNENCFFSHLIQMRQSSKDGKLTKEERKWISNNPKIFNLESIYTLEEQEELDEFERLLEQGGD